jgi:hypothetical protein
MEARLFKVLLPSYGTASKSRSTFRIVSIYCLAVLGSLLCCNSLAFAQRHPGQKFVVHSQNFIVFAASPDWAAKVSQSAEKYRRDLAVYWLGEELPPWSQRCPIHVTAGQNLGASGETRFSPTVAGVGNWMMSVNGSHERILDSVLPHEISHTILATHFAAFAQRGQFVPRWADEGACTTVEHESEKKKHRHFLVQFLQTGRGLAFNRMFRLKEYPADILPLYAQGHSAVQFLIDQSSPQEFIQFLEQGMQTGSWQQALQDHYAYRSIGEFQSLWNKWLFDGSPTQLAAYAPRVAAEQPTLLASNAGDVTDRTASEGKIRFAIGRPGPAPAMLASHAQQQRTNASAAESWYKQRLRQVQSQQGLTHLANNDVVPSRQERAQVEDAALPRLEGLPEMNPILGQASIESQSFSRPQPMQSAQVQILEPGNSFPRSGVRSMAPNAQRPLPYYGHPSSKQALPSELVLPSQPLPPSDIEATTTQSSVRMVPIRR